MKAVAIILALAGLAAGALLVAHVGFAAVGAALVAIHWRGFLAICCYHLALYLLLGWAWRALAPPSVPAPFGVFVAGRIIRDAGSEVLPLSQIGGYVLGAGAATRLGVGGSLALASTIVDVTLELLGQLVYTALGLALLVSFNPRTSLADPILLGLAAAVAVTGGFILAQHKGVGVVERLVRRLAVQWVPKTIAGAVPVQEAICAIYRHPRGLALGFVLHVAGWLLGGAEAWLALYLMGVRLSLGAVFAIESLVYAIRSVAFLVPNAVGVQEGAYLMLGGMFGLGPDTALALSLLKRARDITIGVPALLAWQVLEGGRLWRRQSPAARGDPHPSEDAGSAADRR